MIQREQLDLSSALPGPMALRRERATYPEALADISEEDRVREILLEFNERVLADRRRPVATAASPLVAGRVDVEEMVSRWRAVRAERAADRPPVLDQVREDSGATTKRRRQWWRR